MTPECPLCCCSNNSATELLELRLLSGLYKRQFGIALPGAKERQIELRACRCCDLRFYHPAMAGDEEFYERLQGFDWYYLTEKEEYDIAAQHVAHDASVLEVGVGYGAFAKRIETKAYVGLELSESAVAMARRRGLSVYKSTIEAYATEHEGKHDVVCSFQVLEHVTNPRSFIEASLRCLKPGGRLIQSVPSESSFLSQEINNILNMPPHHLTRWTDTALRRLAELFGLALVEIRHDALSEMHVQAYASTRIRKSLNRILGREHRSLDAKFATLFARAGVRGLSFFPEMLLRFRRSKLAGHSVTAVYLKA